MTNLSINMAPKTSTQYEEIREKRKRQIMNVAIELFASNGFSNTSISQIAAKAKISKGLMYNYYSSKDDLLKAIFDKGFGEMFEMFDPNKDGVLTRDEFIAFIEVSFDLMEQQRDFYKLYFALMMQPPVWKKLKIEMYEIIGPVIKLMMDYYQSKGVENPEMEAVLMGALLDGVGFNFVFNPEMFPLENLKKLIIERFV